jgi:hypothetical protein
MSQNIFYSYWTEKSELGYYVGCTDVDGVNHKIVLCPTEKIADLLEKQFDNLAMDEEIELFGKAYLSDDMGFKSEQCEGCGTKDLPCFCEARN